MADIVDIKCAKCDVPLQGAATDPQPTDMVSCPKCGVSDSLENVSREVGEYVEEKTAESMEFGYILKATLIYFRLLIL